MFANKTTRARCSKKTVTCPRLRPVSGYVKGVSWRTRSQGLLFPFRAQHGQFISFSFRPPSSSTLVLEMLRPPAIAPRYTKYIDSKRKKKVYHGYSTYQDNILELGRTSEFQKKRKSFPWPAKMRRDVNWYEQLELYSRHVRWNKLQGYSKFAVERSSFLDKLRPHIVSARKTGCPRLSIPNRN
jgi:hypothetical protein